MKNSVLLLSLIIAVNSYSQEYRGRYVCDTTYEQLMIKDRPGDSTYGKGHYQRKISGCHLVVDRISSYDSVVLIVSKADTCPFCHRYDARHIVNMMLMEEIKRDSITGKMVKTVLDDDRYVLYFDGHKTISLRKFDLCDRNAMVMTMAYNDYSGTIVVKSFDVNTPHGKLLMDVYRQIHDGKW